MPSMLKLASVLDLKYIAVKQLVDTIKVPQLLNKLLIVVIPFS